MKRTRGKREWIGWAGFCDGDIHHNVILDGYSITGQQAAIFTTRAAARARYADVRRVRITIMENYK